jgi:hypothetical protein
MLFPFGTLLPSGGGGCIPCHEGAAGFWFEVVEGGPSGTGYGRVGAGFFFELLFLLLMLLLLLAGGLCGGGGGGFLGGPYWGLPGIGGP